MKKKPSTSKTHKKKQPRKDKQWDKTLENTFPASDATAKY